MPCNWNRGLKIQHSLLNKNEAGGCAAYDVHNARFAQNLFKGHYQLSWIIRRQKWKDI